MNASDYLATYSNQWCRRRLSDLIDRLEEIQQMKIIWADGIEFVRINYVTDLQLE